MLSIWTSLNKMLFGKELIKSWMSLEMSTYFGLKEMSKSLPLTKNVDLSKLKAYEVRFLMWLIYQIT